MNDLLIGQKPPEPETAKLEGHAFIMLPITLDIEVPIGISREELHDALKNQLLIDIKRCVAIHTPENIVVRAAYKHKDMEYVLKMRGDGTILPTEVPSAMPTNEVS